MSEKGVDWDLIPPQLAYGWLLALCYDAGWTNKWKQMQAVCVIMAESQGYARAWHLNDNNSLDSGLAQINDLHLEGFKGNIWNPKENIAMARKIYEGRGDQFNAWAAFNSGAYKKFMPKTLVKYLRMKWKNDLLPKVDRWDVPDMAPPIIPTP